MRKRRLGLAAALLSALALAGCASSPTPVASSPQSITLKSNGSSGSARSTAQDHCQAWGLRAVPQGGQGTGADRTEHFACR
jgi:hypothetical protein